MTITIFILFIPILVIILLIANLLLAIHRPDSEKVTPYECGFSPVYGQTRNPFSISFYIIGIIFIIMDLEILLVYPIAGVMYTIGTYGFWIFIIFFLILTIGFVFEFGSGALYFTDKRSQINIKLFNSLFITIIISYKYYILFLSRYVVIGSQAIFRI